MLYRVVVCVENLDPPCDLALRFLEGHDPFKSRVIGPHPNISSQKIVPELLQAENDAEKLPPGDAVIALCLLQGTASCLDIRRRNPGRD